MIILDTNVVSTLMSPDPDRHVWQWMDRQSRPSLWTTSVTVYEIRFGLALMRSGKRRNAYLQAFEEVVGDLGGRVATFDTAAAEFAAELSASRRIEGRPIDFRDTMIAGIAIANHATIATRNTRHFGDVSVPVINPWD